MAWWLLCAGGVERTWETRTLEPLCSQHAAISDTHDANVTFHYGKCRVQHWLQALWSDDADDLHHPF